MSEAQKQSLGAVEGLFEDFDESQVADLPTFDPFPVGTYKGLRLHSELVESGSTATKDLWKRIEVNFELLENTEVNLAASDAILPSDGSKSQFTFTLAQFDKESDKVIKTTAPHKAKNQQGEEYEAKGSFAIMNKNFIQSSNGFIKDKDIPALIGILGKEPLVDVKFGLRQGKAKDDGTKPVYQTIEQIVYHVD